MSLALYRAVTTASLPLIRIYLALRKARGKEDKDRFPERCGVSAMARPAGPLVWLHAASVGESLSMLTLIERLRKDYPDFHVLVTTGTLTSAALMAERLPDGAFHQYVPVDRTRYVRRFLDHWRPDLILWAESEFWPNLLSLPAEMGVPMVLVNGRVSPSAFIGWRRFGGLIQTLLGGFVLCMGQTKGDTERLAALGAGNTKCLGNIKFAANDLPVDDRELAALRLAVDGRRCWLASSTHAGEEEIAGFVHSAVKKRHCDILTIIVPRHPGRGVEVASMLKGAGLNVALRSTGGTIGDETDVYIADTMGELGLFYRLVDIVFIGKSLVSLGGQNPLEAARLDCAIIFGPHMTNFAEIAESLKDVGGAIEVADGTELAATISRLVEDEKKRAYMAASAKDLASRQADVLDMVMVELKPLLETCAMAENCRASP